MDGHLAAWFYLTLSSPISHPISSIDLEIKNSLLNSAHKPLLVGLKVLPQYHQPQHVATES